jgi:hypothetical protein
MSFADLRFATALNHVQNNRKMQRTQHAVSLNNIYFHSKNPEPNTLNPKIKYHQNQKRDKESRQVPEHRKSEQYLD